MPDAVPTTMIVTAAGAGAADSAYALDLEAHKGANETSEGVAEGCLMSARLHTVSAADLGPTGGVWVVLTGKHGGLVSLDGA